MIKENTTLRWLLHQRGVAESEIVATLGGLPDSPYNQVSAVPTLNTMLERRITCSTLLSRSASAEEAASSPWHIPSAMNCSQPPSPASTFMATSPRVSYLDALFTTKTPPPVPVINFNKPCIKLLSNLPANDILVRRQIMQQDEIHHADEE